MTGSRPGRCGGRDAAAAARRWCCQRTPRRPARRGDRRQSADRLSSEARADPLRRHARQPPARASASLEKHGGEALAKQDGLAAAYRRRHRERSQRTAARLEPRLQVAAVDRLHLAVDGHALCGRVIVDELDVYSDEAGLTAWNGGPLQRCAQCSVPPVTRIRAACESGRVRGSRDGAGRESAARLRDRRSRGGAERSARLGATRGRVSRRADGARATGSAKTTWSPTRPHTGRCAGERRRSAERGDEGADQTAAQMLAEFTRTAAGRPRAGAAIYASPRGAL